MALISFGQTFRTSNVGFGLKNPGIENVIVSLLGLNIKAGTTEVVPLDLFDAYYFNPRHPQVYNVKPDGSPYVNDVVDLAKLIATGTLHVTTTTYVASSNTFTVGASAAPTVAGSSIFFA